MTVNIMKLQDARKLLEGFDQKGISVYTIASLKKIMGNPPEQTFHKTLKRLVKEEVLIKAVRGIYVYAYAYAADSDSYTLQHIARAMRQGEYLYLSMESVLSEAGYISQILIDRITVMTTGREGTHHTPFGVIEFVHTKRSLNDTLPYLKKGNGGLLEATAPIAWRDLKRVGRNIDMVQNVPELEMGYGLQTTC